MALAHEQKHELPEAIGKLRMAILLSDAPLYQALLGHASALAGDRKSAFQVLDKLQAVSNRVLKKSQPVLLVETKARLYGSAYARNRYPTEFDVQLPVAGRACTWEPSVAADSADGR